MLTEAQKNKIEEIRQSVKVMIAYRENASIDPVFKPSGFWRQINAYMAYILDLPVEHLENIRCHIGMGYFIGPSWETEFYQGFRATDDVIAAEFPLVQKYIAYTEGLPEALWASEPASNELTSAIGIKYKNRRISADVVKEQATICNLYNLGLIAETQKEPKAILDIGPGYGQLVYQLSRVLDPASFFACVDCPEMLFWSSVFLTVNSDPDSIYIWRPGAKVSLSDLRRRYRFAFLPNFTLDTLGDEEVFDLAINKNSFQEMSENQITLYAKNLSRILKGWLYSYNASRQFMNKEIQSSVHGILAQYFLGGPTDDEYRNMGVSFIDEDAKKLFVGYSKTLKTPPRRGKNSNVVWLAERPVLLTAKSISGFA